MTAGPRHGPIGARAEAARTVPEMAGPVDDATRAVAFRLAAGGRVDAAAQRQALHDLLEAGSACRPADVLTALDERAAGGEVAAVARARARLETLGGRLIVVGDADYPPQLSDAWPELGAPAWLFAVGHVPCGPGAAVAVVGTRRPTADGIGTARALGSALATAGVVVVSGMARGIDQAAHRGAVAAGGATVAVLGTGLGVDYPARSAALRRDIRSCGALLTELPPGVGPRPWHFLARNRIISGLATATVVVEGREHSGALQTARLAGGQGRDVWAVPGSINAPTSAAPLALLRDGATPLTAIDDFVAAVTGAPVTAAGPAPGVAPLAPDVRARLSSAASAVYDLIGAVPATTDVLVAASRLPAPAVLAAVAELVDHRIGAMTPHGLVRRSASAARLPGPRELRRAPPRVAQARDASGGRDGHTHGPERRAEADQQPPGRR